MGNSTAGAIAPPRNCADRAIDIAPPRFSGVLRAARVVTATRAAVVAAPASATHSAKATGVGAIPALNDAAANTAAAAIPNWRVERVSDHLPRGDPATRPATPNAATTAPRR